MPDPFVKRQAKKAKAAETFREKEAKSLTQSIGTASPTVKPLVQPREKDDGRSQHKNLEKAVSVLRSRLYQAELDRINDERAAQRKTLVASGDRSAKVRTYNYPQGRITDHRINKTMYNLGSFMNGDIQDMIDALKMAENAEKLKGDTE